MVAVVQIHIVDITILPYPPADLVLEGLWGQRSPEIQAPPGKKVKKKKHTVHNKIEFVGRERCC